jgi:3-oxoacyl-[acyl-carrier protein] reductase
MSDVLLALGRRPTARKVAKALGLPVPLPQDLDRDRSPWRTQSLEGKTVLLCGDPRQHNTIQQDLAAAGAQVTLSAPEEAASLRQVNILIYDARALAGPADLRLLYDFFHEHITKLTRCGRVVLIGQRPRPSDSPARAAAMAALEGFGRSLGREVGRYGSTVHTLMAAPSNGANLSPALRFLCSARSAFSSGQTLTLSKPKRVNSPVYEQPLAGKIAIITGAGRGIGAATARAYAREGASVIAVDRPGDHEVLEQLCAEIGAQPVLCDVTQADAAERLRAASPDGVDILLHNAGLTRDKTLKKMSQEQWDLTLDVNLSAVVAITEQLSEHLRDNGRVIVLSSIAGIAGNMGQTNYATAKAGLIGFVHQLGPKLAPRGITVNAVAPGFIETRLTGAIPLATREAARRLSNLAQGGQPVDVAEVLTFLGSPGSQGLQANVWRVCGGGFIGA